MQKLNQQQQDVVDHINGPAAVMSAPGSGKTFVITERAVNLIKQGAKPSSLLCLTFTNKASKEMR